jgi:hypothetical protein
MNQLIDLWSMSDRDRERPCRTVQHCAEPVVILDVGAEILHAKIARAILRCGPPSGLLGKVLWKGGDHPAIGRADGECVSVRSSSIGGRQLGRQIEARRARIVDGNEAYQVGSPQPELPIA